MYSRGAAIFAFALLTGVLAPAMPWATAQQGTTCTFDFDVVATPGLSTEGTSGTVRSDGENGTVTCDGPVNGAGPTGQGTSGYDGYYGTADPDTCQNGGEGKGTFSITVPTADGEEKVVDDKNIFEYGALKGGALISGTFDGARMSGTFEARPMKGDCASAPVTEFHVSGTALLK